MFPLGRRWPQQEDDLRGLEAWAAQWGRGAPLNPEALDGDGHASEECKSGPVAGSSEGALLLLRVVEHVREADAVLRGERSRNQGASFFHALRRPMAVKPAALVGEWMKAAASLREQAIVSSSFALRVSNVRLLNTVIGERLRRRNILNVLLVVVFCILVAFIMTPPGSREVATKSGKHTHKTCRDGCVGGICFVRTYPVLLVGARHQPGAVLLVGNVL